MPPKKKDGKKKKKSSLEEEARAKAEAVDDIDDEDYKKSLRKECRLLEEQIRKEEDLAGLYQDERQRVNYFWIVAKKELEDKEAEQRNKERELQDLSEKHQIEIKIYKQRVKHLLFQNLDQLTELKKEAQITLKNVEDEHRIDERELKQDLRALKVQKKEQEVRHSEYLNALTKDKNKQATKIRAEYERIANEIQLKYKHKMLLLREEMERKRKAMIQQIENKKNQAIKDLTQKHAKKYNDIKNYYQEITNTNLDIIKQLKDELTDAKKEDTSKQKQKMDQEEANKQVVEPLQKASEEVKKLSEKKKKHDTIMDKLKECQAFIMEHDSVLKDIEWQYEVRLQQFQYLQREKKELFDEFHQTVYEIHQKTGLRNLVLEKKLETIQESLETKDAQINQLLAAAKIDPKTLGIIKSTLEEVENLKNEAIKEIQAELKKIREAHSNMVKTYEGKLSEFGIPVEELGFDPLVPANI
ncbi:growth-arrest-specific protein 8 [Stylonychia lemnae]|uniref:Growth-arrest-specific protein 8 n=1 Tax=Stylonychia lemnae TaxID=5949 RepID=A0A078A7X9_STYLE|nr:growth-arrest-specific protein 8 [Stylonychia lemnae]|eukprot:CDW78359.1 growth-arrest-specific protein 8 [Stylonychia lemnae]